LFEGVREIKFSLSKPSNPWGSHVYLHPVTVDFGNRWKWVVSFTSRPFYHRE